MVKFTFNIAETAIGVTCLHESTKEYCSDYLTDAEPDIEITVTQEDIDYERTRAEETTEIRVKSSLRMTTIILSPFHFTVKSPRRCLTETPSSSTAPRSRLTVRHFFLPLPAERENPPTASFGAGCFPKWVTRSLP